MAETVRINILADATSTIASLRRVTAAIQTFKRKVIDAVKFEVAPVLSIERFTAEYETWRSTYLAAQQFSVTPQMDTAGFSFDDLIERLPRFVQGHVLHVKPELDESEFEVQLAEFEAHLENEDRLLFVTPFIEDRKLKKFKETYGGDIALTVKPKLDVTSFRAQWQVFRQAYLNRAHAALIVPELHGQDVIANEGRITIEPTLQIEAFRARYRIFAAVYLRDRSFAVFPELRLDRVRNVDDVIDVFTPAAERAGENAGNRFGLGFLRRAGSRLALGAIRLFFTSVVRLAAVAGAALVGFAAIGGAVIGVQMVAAFAAMAAAAAGSLGALPALVGLGVAAMGTLKLATAGVGDAVSAALTGSLKDFDESLKAIPASARPFARAVRALRPEFDALRNAVAGRFFAGLDGELGSLARTFLPLVTSLTTSIAETMNRAARAVSAFMKSADGSGSVAAIFRDIKTSFGSLAKAAVPMVSAALTITKVGASILPQMTAGFVDSADAFAARMKKSAESGALKEFITGGLSALKALGGVVKSVGSILKSIFIDASGAASGMLGGLSAGLKSVADFLNSGPGEAMISSIFSVFGSIATELKQALAEVLPALAQMFGRLAPVIQPLANAMSNFLIALAPVLPVVGDLARQIGIALIPVFDILGPTLATLLPVVAQLIGALLPIVPVIARLASIFATALGTAITTLIPVITQLIDTLGPVFVELFRALAPVVTALARSIGLVVELTLPLLPLLGDIIGDVAGFLPLIFEVAASLVAALAPALPIVAKLLGFLGGEIGKLVQNLAPLLTSIALWATELITRLMPVIEPLIGVVVELASALGGILASVLDALLPIVKPVADLLVAMLPPDLLRAVGELVIALGPLLTLVAELVALIVQALLPVLTPVIQLVGWLTTWFVRLVAIGLKVVVDAIYHLFEPAMRVCQRILTRFADETLPMFKKGVGDLVEKVKRIGIDVINGMIQGARERIAAVRELFNKLGDYIPGWLKTALGIHSPSRVMASVGQSIIDGLNRGMRQQIPHVERTIGSVASTIEGLSATPTVTLAAQASVAPTAVASTSDATLSAMPPVSITVNVAPGADPAETGRQVVRAIEAWQRRTGIRYLATT